LITQKTLIKQALTLWAELPEDQQNQLKGQVLRPIVLFGEKIEGLMGARVIRLDSQKLESPTVVGAFFNMDLSINCKYRYLFADDVPTQKKEAQS
jgi:hypothetical protein